MYNIIIISILLYLVHFADGDYQMMIHWKMNWRKKYQYLECWVLLCYLYRIKRIVSAARSLTCRDDLDSKWRLLLAENELSCVSLLSSISIGN